MARFRRFLPLAATGGASGSLAQTLGALTLASAGSAPAAGTLAQTLGALTLSSSGSAPASGTLAQTLGALALASTGSAPASGALTQTLGALSLASVGSAPASGALAVSLGALALASTGVAASGGTLTVTLGDLTLASTGSAPASGAFAQTLGDLALSSSGSAPASGTLAVTLGALSLASAGSAPGVAETWNPADKHADIALSNGNLTATKTGTLGDASVRGLTARGGTTEWYYEFTPTVKTSYTAPGIANASFALSDWLGKDTNSAALYGDGAYYNSASSGGSTPYGVGAVVGVHWKPATGEVLFYIDGTLVATVSTGLTSAYPALTLRAVDDAGTANFGATAFAHQPAGTTAWSAGPASATGSLAATLGALALASTGSAPATGTLTATLGALTLASTGTLGTAAAVGTLTATLGALALAASGSAPARGTLVQSLGPLALASVGSAPARGALAVTLGPLVLQAADLVARTGSLGVTLGPLVLVSTGQVQVLGPVETLPRTERSPRARPFRFVASDYLQAGPSVSPFGLVDLSLPEEVGGGALPEEAWGWRDKGQAATLVLAGDLREDGIASVERPRAQWGWRNK